MPLFIEEGDLTRCRTDAVVNAANTQLRMGGGVCGAIFRAAGPERMQAACAKAAPIRTGEAVHTPGFALPARYVIHTAGPVYRGGDQGEERLLRAAYTNSLRLARELGLRSIAFPLLSSGIYGYPLAGALEAAIGAIEEFLAEEEMDVYLVLTSWDKYLSDETLPENLKNLLSEQKQRQ